VRKNCLSAAIVALLGVPLCSYARGPNNVTVEVRSGDIVVSWDPVARTRGYSIFRKAGEQTDFQYLGSVPSTVTTYTDIHPNMSLFLYSSQHGMLNMSESR